MNEEFAPTWWLPRLERRAVAAGGLGGPVPAPLVAILCEAPRGRDAAAGIALALARATRRPCALVGVVGEGVPGSIGGTPRAQRAARALRERGLPTTASGRLVWLCDRRGALEEGDIAGRVAATSAELGRAAAFVGVPAATALPFARTAALDRVLAWHDAIVVVREPDAAALVIERALASLAELGRPVVAMAPLGRLSGMLASGGVAPPSEAVRAVAALALDGEGDGSRDA